MYEFKSEDTFELTKTAVKGVVYVVSNPHECMNFKHLVGEEVMIDGVKRVVKAVERFAHTPPYRAGERIALLTEKDENV